MLEGKTINILWTALSLCVAIITSFGFMQPFWVVQANRRTSFGQYNFCQVPFYCFFSVEIKGSNKMKLLGMTWSGIVSGLSGYLAKLE